MNSTFSDSTETIHKGNKIRKRNLFLDELREEAFGLSGGDVAAVVTPDENATFDIQQKQRRSSSCHVSLIQMRSDEIMLRWSSI